MDIDALDRKVQDLLRWKETVEPMLQEMLPEYQKHINAREQERRSIADADRLAGEETTARAAADEAEKRDGERRAAAQMVLDGPGKNESTAGAGGTSAASAGSAASSAPAVPASGAEAPHRFEGESEADYEARMETIRAATHVAGDPNAPPA